MKEKRGIWGVLRDYCFGPPTPKTTEHVGDRPVMVSIEVFGDYIIEDKEFESQWALEHRISSGCYQCDDGAWRLITYININYITEEQ